MLAIEIAIRRQKPPSLHLRRCPGVPCRLLSDMANSMPWTMEIGTFVITIRLAGVKEVWMEGQHGSVSVTASALASASVFAALRRLYPAVPGPSQPSRSCLSDSLSCLIADRSNRAGADGGMFGLGRRYLACWFTKPGCDQQCRLPKAEKGAVGARLSGWCANAGRGFPFPLLLAATLPATCGLWIR